MPPGDWYSMPWDPARSSNSYNPTIYNPTMPGPSTRPDYNGMDWTPTQTSLGPRGTYGMPTRSHDPYSVPWTPTQTTFRTGGYGGGSNSMQWSPTPGIPLQRSMSIDSMLNEPVTVNPQMLPLGNGQAQPMASTSSGCNRYGNERVFLATTRPISLLTEPANIDLENHARNAAASNLGHYGWGQHTPVGLRLKRL